jgi:HAD superfamily hydrolase (TIGR01509 family)
MQHLNLQSGIDGIITGDDVEHSKPAPDPFLEAMRREGVTPEETIIFEDSAVGVEAARRSGAPYVVIRMD